MAVPQPAQALDGCTTRPTGTSSADDQTSGATERYTSMLLHPRPAPPHRSSWLLAARGPGRARRRPPKTWPQLLGHDLHDGSGAAVLSRPGPLLEPTHDHDPAALRQRLGGVLGLVAPHHDGEERRLLVLPGADGHPEDGPGDAGLVVPQLGVVGEVAGEAHAGLGHGASLLNAWPGGLPCPWNRGTVDTVACCKTTRGKRWSQRSRPCDQDCRAGSAQEPGWLVECLRLGVGHASTVRPDRSTLGAAGERGSRHEGRSPARARQAPELGLLASGSSQGRILSRAPD